MGDIYGVKSERLQDGTMRITYNDGSVEIWNKHKLVREYQFADFNTLMGWVRTRLSGKVAPP